MYWFFFIWKYFFRAIGAQKIIKSNNKKRYLGEINCLRKNWKKHHMFHILYWHNLIHVTLWLNRDIIFVTHPIHVFFLWEQLRLGITLVYLNIQDKIKKTWQPIWYSYSTQQTKELFFFLSKLLMIYDF